MRSHLPSVVAGIALAVTSALAIAQDSPQPPPTEQPPGPPLYRVELIVFAYRDFDATEEHFEHEQPPPPPLVDALPREVPQFDDTSFPFPDAAPDALTPETSTPAEAPSSPARVVPTEPPVDETGSTEPAAEAAAEDAFRFRLLEPDEYQLDAALETLERVAAYVPLVHGGWVEPGLPDEEAQPVDLALLGSSNPTGTVRVYLSRFLHIELNLTYRGSTGTPAAEPDAPDTLREVSLAPRYRLVTQRQMRSGELHYFDHPAFGVLVMITPVPVEPVNPPETEPGRPAA